jgi:hypothetical protein
MPHSEFIAHSVAKPIILEWIDPSTLCSFGFSSENSSEVKLWDTRMLSKPFYELNISKQNPNAGLLSFDSENSLLCISQKVNILFIQKFRLFISFRNRPSLYSCS